VWLDGACGAYADGKSKQNYDFKRYFELIRTLAPDACISNCGPDVRWVGNEGGYARESEWNVVPRFAFDLQTIESNSQQADDGKFAKKGADVVASDLGSREFLSNFEDFVWYPAEVDVSIRPGWFYHKSQDRMVRSLKNLLRIYYNSVGGNSILLLNVPPDKRGLIHEKDVETLKKFGEHISQSGSQQVKISEIAAPVSEIGCEIENIFDDSIDVSDCNPLGFYTPERESDQYSFQICLDEERKINRVKIIENVAYSQRIESFQIFAYVNGARKKVYDGTTVGYGRIALFKPVKTQKLEIVLSKVRKKPYIEFIGVYEDNGYVLKKPALYRFKQWIHRVNYKVFIDKENKNYSE